MISFHNDQKIKDFYISRVKKHIEMDEVIKGVYYEQTDEKIRACGVGCTIHGSDHSKYETELGIPTWIAKVEDRIFEGLPDARSKLWPQEFLESIPVGKDLDQIKIPFLIFIAESFVDKSDHNKYPNIKKKVDRVLYLLKNDPTNKKELLADAAAYAADAVAVAAAYASRENAYVIFADKLLELLRGCE